MAILNKFAKKNIFRIGWKIFFNQLVKKKVSKCLGLENKIYLFSPLGTLCPLKRGKFGIRFDF